MARIPLTQAPPLCELCRSPAHVLCPSDDAFLCWRCDSMVHSANFLVARHHRTYLCSCCACPTMMVASGAVLRSRGKLCTSCAIVPTEDCCSTGSGSSESDCSMLTSEDDEEFVRTPGSCGSQSSMSCVLSKRKQPSEFELQVPKENLDTLQGSDSSDGMSGVEDEMSSSGEYGTLSRSSNIGNDTQGNATSRSRQGRSFCRSSKA